MFCFYDCMIEDLRILWNIVECPEEYDGVTPFVQSLTALTRMIDKFTFEVVMACDQKTLEDHKKLMQLVLNHPQWHAIQQLAGQLHTQLKEAHQASKKTS